MEPNNTNENLGGMNNEAVLGYAASGPAPEPVTPAPAPTPESAPAPAPSLEPASAPAPEPAPVLAPAPESVNPMPNPASNPALAPVPMGAPAKPDNKNKTRLILIIIIVLVIVIGVVVAVIMMNSGKKTTPPAVQTDELEIETDETTSDDEEVEDSMTMAQATNAYNKIISDITNKIIDEGIKDQETTIAIYKQNLDAAKDAKVKAMLAFDYYQLVMDNRADETAKQEVLDGLVEADSILQTATSANKVSKIAAYYGDSELAERYANLANERAE